MLLLLLCYQSTPENPHYHAKLSLLQRTLAIMLLLLLCYNSLLQRTSAIMLSFYHREPMLLRYYAILLHYAINILQRTYAIIAISLLYRMCCYDEKHGIVLLLLLLYHEREHNTINL